MASKSPKPEIMKYRSSHSEVFLGKGVPKICSKFTGEHPCRSVISIKLLSNFIEITLQNGCSSVNLLHIFRKPFLKNTSEWLLVEHGETITGPKLIGDNFNNSFGHHSKKKLTMLISCLITNYQSHVIIHLS